MSLPLAEIQKKIDEDGVCVIPSVLDAAALQTVRDALDQAVEKMTGRGISAFDPRLDPNAQNIRVNNLPDFNPVFVDLLRHPDILPVVKAILGTDAYVSNFTANVALPGSGSMRLHSDHALVAPPPWTDRWAINMIWCLDDVREENGATRYIPGSHRYRTFSDLPDKPETKTRPFSASAGSVIVMEGRIWHTSGKNVTQNERRGLLFAYYSRGFVRAQINWDVTLSPETKASLDDDAQQLLGMGPVSNAAFAYDLVIIPQ